MADIFTKKIIKPGAAEYANLQRVLHESSFTILDSAGAKLGPNGLSKDKDGRTIVPRPTAGKTFDVYYDYSKASNIYRVR